MESVSVLRVALLLTEENKTKWGSIIGYFVVVELRVALSLADECVTTWRSPLRVVRTARRTLSS